MKDGLVKVLGVVTFLLVMGALGMAAIPNPGHKASMVGGDNDADRTFNGTSGENYTFPTNLNVDGNLGVGTRNPQASVHINKTDAIIIPVGDTSERPSSSLPGQMRYNDQTKAFEGYNGIAWGSIGGAVFVGLTAGTYTGDIDNGSLSGYDAANNICNTEFEGSHMCLEGEVINTIYASNISAIGNWTGTAWINAGGAKYAPASLPVNDCNGWRHGAAGTYLGNFWIFEKPNGGSGAVVNCGSLKALACCR